MKPKHIFTLSGVIIALTVCCLLVTGQAEANSENDIAMLDRSAKAFSSVVRKAGPAVVYIGVEKNKQAP
jgi:serine protease Do